NPETEQGLYQFLVAPGNYKVREAHQDGWTETFPTGPTELASVGGAGSPANGDSTAPALSDEALFVAFESEASNLVPRDTNGLAHVCVYARRTGTTQRVSVDSAGNQANGASSAPVLAAHGRFVAFVSAASNLVPGDTNGIDDVFVYDRLTG